MAENTDDSSEKTSNKISITVKTAKEKETIQIDEDASVKEVSTLKLQITTSQALNLVIFNI